MKVVVTRSAFKDLAGIWTYIAADSIDAADRVRDDLYAAMRRLADMPGMGHRRDDVSNPTYRFWSVHSYLIAYRRQQDTLLISRVVHGARNVKRIFRKKRSR